MATKPSRSARATELRELRARLADAGEALRAIRSGNVDAVLVPGERGEQVFTLRGADRAYRQLVESMSEGAATLSADGVILYCNQRLAGMLERPLDQVMGTALRDYVPPADQSALGEILARARTELGRWEFNLRASSGQPVPVYLSASRLQGDGAEPVLCLILTDLTEKKGHEQMVAAERLSRSILEQAAEAIVVCDTQGRIIRISQAAQGLCDGTPFLRPFAEMFPLRTGAADPFHLAPVLLGETLRNVDVVLDGPERERDLLLNAGPLLSGQEILGCVVTLTDITERKRAAAALQTSLEDFRTLAEAMPQIVWITRPDGWNVFFNQHWMEYTGLTLEESLGHGWNKPFHPDDQERAWTAWQKATSENGLYSIEARLRRADGVYRWYLVRGVPLLDAAGTILKWYGTCTDIHDLKTAELEIVSTNRALRESERRFSDLLDSVELVAMMLDGAGRITYCNDHLLHLTGWERKDVIGRSWFEMFVPPDLIDRKVPFFAALLANQAEALHHETEILTRSGERRLVRFDNMVLRSSVGDVTGTASIGEDITERRRAEEKLRGSEERLRDVMVSAGDWVWEVDANGVYTYSSENAFDLLGWSPEEVVGKTPFAFMPPEEAQRVAALFSEIAAAKAPIRDLQNWNVKKNGERVCLLTSAVPMLDDAGHLRGYRGVDKDITDRKQAEEARQHREAELRESQRIARIGSWEWTIATGAVMWSEGMDHIVARGLGSPGPTFETLSRLYTPGSPTTSNSR
jgi:PAS domain S-box-containing protein